VHGAVARLLPHYHDAGVKLPEVKRVEDGTPKEELRRCLVVTPSSAEGTPWLRRFGEISTGFASGWMRIRGARRRQALDRGFAMSDHADWDGLISAIRATGASRVLVTHGSMEPMVRWLRENGWQADPLATRFTGETAGDVEEKPAATS
jgi:putative mRNA 3-end processing factor